MATKKITVNLPSEQVEFLQRIAEREHLTFTDVLRRSINTEKFFITQEDSNNKILVEDTKTARIREVLRNK